VIVALGVRARPSRFAERFAVFCSPLTVTCLALLFNIAALAAVYQQHPDARYFVHMGTRFLRESRSSAVIRVDPRLQYDTDRSGYDGQFFYYIALDPVHARDYMHEGSLGSPAYRYTRILYPMLARLLSLGNKTLIPFMLLLINLVSLGVATWICGLWLRRHGLSAWWAGLYGLFPGMMFALQHDLAEPLSYALAAGAMYLFDPLRPRRLLASAALFSLAALARETTLVLAIPFGIALLSDRWGRRAGDRVTAGRRTARALLYLAGVAGPLALYKLFLLWWLGSLGFAAGSAPAGVPFGGLTARWPFDPAVVFLVVAIVVPGLLAATAALVTLVIGPRPPEVWALLLAVLVNVVFLNAFSYSAYSGTGRLSGSIVLAMLFSLPAIDAVTGRDRWWLWASAICWLSFAPFYLYVVPAWVLAPLLYLLVMGIFLSQRATRATAAV